MHGRSETIFLLTHLAGIVLSTALESLSSLLPAVCSHPWVPSPRQVQQKEWLYSWRFSRYSAPIHWLVHGHMTSNNETVSRQMPSPGNIAKTMTSNGKQFTVTREMLTAVARDQGVQLKVAWFCRRNPSAFFKICFCFVLLYNKSLNDCSPRDQSLSV